MTTSSDKIHALHVTRVLIFIMGTIAALSSSPLSTILAISSLAAWLWMPQLVQLELSLLNKWRKYKEENK